MTPLLLLVACAVAVALVTISWNGLLAITLLVGLLALTAGLNWP